MSYIVVYQRGDGSAGHEECASLDSAVVAAERLRNVDAVEHPRILKTEEVKFDFRPYYRVEVSSETEDSSPVGDSFAAPVAVDEFVPPPPVEEFVRADSRPAPVADVAPPVPVEPEPAAEESAEPSAIDPWAASEGSPVDYSLSDDASGEADPAPATEAAESVDAEAAVEPEDMGSPARGLFSTHSLPDPPKDSEELDNLAEDISEAVPPRRGLFGR